MATADSTVAIPQDPKRRDVAIRATQQLEAVFFGIIDCIQRYRDGPSDGSDGVDVFTIELFPDIIRSLAIRGKALNNVLMSGLGDDALSTEEFAEVVDHG